MEKWAGPADGGRPGVLTATGRAPAGAAATGDPFTPKKRKHTHAHTHTKKDGKKGANERYEGKLHPSAAYN